jgi:hypothetical protein
MRLYRSFALSLALVLFATSAGAVRTLKDFCEGPWAASPSLVREIKEVCGEDISHTTLEDSLAKACEKGRINIVKALLDEPELRAQLSDEQIRAALARADLGNTTFLWSLFLAQQRDNTLLREWLLRAAKEGYDKTAKFITDLINQNIDFLGESSLNVILEAIRVAAENEQPDVLSTLRQAETINRNRFDSIRERPHIAANALRDFEQQQPVGFPAPRILAVPGTLFVVVVTFFAVTNSL